MKDIKLSASSKYALILITVVIGFALVYWILPEGAWNEEHPVNGFGDGLYFSVVTITTLGFGDIYPVSLLARIFVCLEVILGVFIVGFYLNAVSTEQADKVNQQSEKRNAAERKSIALARLCQNVPLITPKIDHFILACYEVVTPIKDRHLQDISKGFEVKYCNMYDLYNLSLLMTNPFGKPLIECFFEKLHNLESELRFTLTNNDLSHWPDLRNCIYDVVTSFSTFEYEQSIVRNKDLVSGAGTPDEEKMTDFIRRTIRDSKEPPEYSRGNMLNAYRALFDMIDKCLTLTISLRKQLNDLSAQGDADNIGLLKKCM